MNPFATATQMLEALRKRELSSAELTEIHIRRIERHDRDINSVVVRDFGRARQGAAKADAVRARREERPLLGLPITIKEGINVAGFSRDGLPVALQAIGPYLEDRTPPCFAALLAQELDGIRTPPRFDD